MIRGLYLPVEAKTVPNSVPEMHDFILGNDISRLTGNNMDEQVTTHTDSGVGSTDLLRTNKNLHCHKLKNTKRDRYIV